MYNYYYVIQSRECGPFIAGEWRDACIVIPLLRCWSELETNRKRSTDDNSVLGGDILAAARLQFREKLEEFYCMILLPRRQDHNSFVCYELRANVTRPGHDFRGDQYTTILHCPRVKQSVSIDFVLESFVNDIINSFEDSALGITSRGLSIMFYK